MGIGVECARTLGSATTLKQAWLNARKLRGLQSVRNRKHNRRLQRGQLGPEALHREGVYLTIRKTSLGHLGYSRWNFFRGTTFCLLLHNAVLMEGSLVLIGKPGDIDPVMIRLGHGLYSSGKIL